MSEWQSWVDVNTLSTVLNVSRNTIRFWAKTGRVPCYQATPGGKFLFNVREVEAALRRPAPQIAGASHA
jgi:excisionase family DNA binding protein